MAAFQLLLPLPSLDQFMLCCVGEEIYEVFWVMKVNALLVPVCTSPSMTLTAEPLDPNEGAALYHGPSQIFRYIWDLSMLLGCSQACLCLTLLNNQVEFWWRSEQSLYKKAARQHFSIVPGVPICTQSECWLSDIHTHSRLKPERTMSVTQCNGLPYISSFFSGLFYPLSASPFILCNVLSLP